MIDRELVTQVAREVAGDRASAATVAPDGAVGLVLAVDGLSQGAATALAAGIEARLRTLGAKQVRIIQTADRGAGPSAEARPANAFRRIVAVASGKGGVGKSTVAANLAVALAAEGRAVGLLDADIYGPSVPTLLGIGARAGLIDKRIQPVEAWGLRALSMGMMTDPEKAVVWRGPMAASALVQMVEQADWGALDALVVDLPPGTGDIQLTMAQKLKPSGAIVVTTPQDLALIDARRAIAMFGQVDVPVLGLVENMSAYACPHCGAISHPFGHGGGEAEAARLGVPFLGHLPLTLSVREASDAGRPPAAEVGGAGDTYRALAARVAAALGL